MYVKLNTPILFSGPAARQPDPYDWPLKTSRDLLDFLERHRHKQGKRQPVYERCFQSATEAFLAGDNEGLQALLPEIMEALRRDDQLRLDWPRESATSRAKRNKELDRAEAKLLAA